MKKPQIFDNFIVQFIGLFHFDNFMEYWLKMS